jgi:exonuclease III
MRFAKISSININGITAQTCVGLLTDIIRRHEFDTLFIQDVTSLEILNVKGYVAHINILTAMRGAAILARNEFPLTNIATIISSRAIAADFSGIRLINV